MAGLDTVGHPLSLKVMRVSRPSLASHWQPFFSTSPSLSAHATAHPLTLQGSDPLPGHPKTLRDLTLATPFLTLPASFGSIQLGETFSCVLSVNNEVGVPVDDVCAKVEMQTGTNKTTLEEAFARTDDQGEGGREGTLAAGDSLEVCVSSEMKELGQHVLACTVTYRTPPGMRPATTGGENSEDPFVQSFRKYYKFMVSLIGDPELKERSILTGVPGHESLVGKNESTRPSESLSSPISIRTRESFPGSPYSKSYSCPPLVREDTSGSCRRMGCGRC